jgi:hypothetical protein
MDVRVSRRDAFDAQRFQHAHEYADGRKSLGWLKSCGWSLAIGRELLALSLPRRPKPYLRFVPRDSRLARNDDWLIAGDFEPDSTLFNFKFEI